MATKQRCKHQINFVIHVSLFMILAQVRYEGEARPEVVEPNDYLGPEGQVRVRQYPKHTKQPYGRY